MLNLNLRHHFIFLLSFSAISANCASDDPRAVYPGMWADSIQDTSSSPAPNDTGPTATVNGAVNSVPRSGCPNLCDSAGDIQSDGLLSVLDVQCGVSTLLATMAGQPTPACAIGDADANCDDIIDISDISVVVVRVLGASLGKTIDHNANGCPDACENKFEPDCVFGSGRKIPRETTSVQAAAACTDPELPDDGIDSDCDGFEYFGSSANNLALSGPIGTPTFNVTVSGTFQMGLFGATTVTGNLTKATPAGPVVWCVQGTSTATVGPVTLNGATLKVCRIANGTFTGTITGSATVSGAQGTAGGTFTAFGALSATVTFATLTLETGIVLQDAAIGLSSGSTNGTLTANLGLGFGNQKLNLTVSGTLPASGNITLTLTQPADKPWAPFGNFTLTLSGTTGELTKVGTDWSASVSGTAPSVTVAPGFVLTNATYSATFVAGAAWTVGFSGTAQLGPFNTTFSGSLTQATPIAPVTGCFSGSTNTIVAGLPMQGTSITACRTAMGTVDIDLTGTVLIEGQTVDFAGELTVPSPWSLSLSLDNITLVPGVVELSNVTLTLAENAASYTLSADLNLTGGTAEFNAAGSYTKTGEVHLTVSLKANQTWQPIPGVDFVATNASGTLDRVNSQWKATITVSANTASAANVALTNVTGTAVVGALGVQLTLSGTATIGPFTLVVTGTLNAPAGGQVSGCLSGSVSSQSIAGIAFPTLMVSTCAGSGQTTTATVTGSMTFEGQTVAITGTVTLSKPTVLTVTAANVQVVPGFVFDSLTLTIESGTVTLSGDMTLGTGAAALPLTLTGTYVSNGPFTLSASLQAGETWNAIPSLGVEVTELSGSITFDNGNVEVALTGALDNDLQLVPGLILKNASLTVALDTDGNLVLGLSGTVQIKIGSSTTNLVVSGTVDGKKFSLSGTIAGTISPLSLIVGDLFQLEDPTVTFTVDTNAGTYTVSFSSTAKICIFAPCSASEYVELTVLGGIVAGSTNGVYFVGELADFELPIFGSVNVTVAVTSVEVNSYDLLGTPLNSSDDVDIPVGITLYTLSPLPISFGGMSQDILFAISVSQANTTISATIPFDWEIIGEDSGFTGIDYLTFDSMTVGGELEPTSTELFISGQATLQPSTQPSPLVGTTSFAIGFGTTGVSFTIEAYVVGRWYDPLGIQKFAIQNPGFEIGIAYSGQLPYPKSFGFNGDIYWLDTLNTWPSETTWPVPTSYPAPAPPNGITMFGGTLYFDLESTPSGLCLLGACLPLPTFIIRLEIANLSFPGTFIDLSNDLFDTLQGYMPDSLPTVDLPDLDLSSIGINVNHFLVYASTHNTEVFGLDYAAGFLADIDVDIYGTNFTLEGFADTAGVYLSAAVEPFDFLGLGIFQIVGDPFRQICELGTGSVEIDHNTAFNLSTGTIEAQVRDNSFGTDPFSSIIVSKDDGTNGYTIGLGDPVNNKAKVSVRYRKNGLERIVTTDNGVVTSGQWTNVSVVFDANNTTIFVNGNRKDLTTTTKQFSGAPGTTSAKVQIGTGLTRIDDIRFWKSQRTPAEIQGEKNFLKQSSVSDLTFSYTGDTNLIARYEFDYDTGTIVHNTRHYDTGGQLNAKLAGNAQINNSLVNNDLYFKLALRVPGSKGSEEGPGLWFQAGFILDLPILGPLSAATQVQISTESIFGSVYIREFTLLPTPVGDFVIGGYGPDFIPDNFDDGLFGFIDLLDVSFGMSAEMAFTEASGPDDVISAGGSVLFACPPTGPCNGPEDHLFQATGDMDLTVDIPGAGDFGLLGAFDILLNSPDWYIKVTGSLVVFSWEFLSTTFFVDESAITFEFVMDFGEVVILGTEIDLGMVLLSMSLDFDALELCGTGEYTHHPEPGDGDVFDCGVTACFGPTDIDIGLGCGDFCIGPAFCLPTEFCYISICTEKLENGEACLKDNYCKSDHCGCIADGFVSLGICFEPNSKTLGQDCYANDECTTNHCTAELCIKGTCVCGVDTDCPNNHYCDQGFIGELGTNSCQPKKANGQSCSSDNKCLSGHCSATSSFDPCGFCYDPDSKDVGESCKANAECVTDQCGSFCGLSGVCKCDFENQCESDEYCNNGTFDDHLCYANKADCETCDADKKCQSGNCSADISGKCYVANSKNVGQTCCVNDQCKSDKCVSGKCVCKNDSDCDSDDGPNGVDGNEHCYNPALGTAYCDFYKNDGVGCDTDSECKSDECGGCVDDIFGINLGTCYTPNSKDYGETCYADNECKSDRCSADCIFDPVGTCKCDTDNDCPSPGTQYCSNGNCYTELADHSYCGTDDEKCSSGNCDCEPAGRCITANNSKSVGSSCYDDDECIGYCTGTCVAGTPWIGECKALKNDCVDCTSANQCKGGYCIWDGEFDLSECVTKNSLNSGQHCCNDQQCKSGDCKKNNIFTEDDNACD